jgi:hypothetical protein
MSKVPRYMWNQEQFHEVPLTHKEDQLRLPRLTPSLENVSRLWALVWQGARFAGSTCRFEGRLVFQLQILRAWWPVAFG